STQTTRSSWAHTGFYAMSPCHIDELPAAVVIPNINGANDEYRVQYPYRPPIERASPAIHARSADLCAIWAAGRGAVTRGAVGGTGAIRLHRSARSHGRASTALPDVPAGCIGDR